MGTVVVSIDAELAWGFHDLDRMPMDRIRNARAGWGHLLELLDKHRVPATWAVVGHLLLDHCDGAHDDHPSLDGWFARDPGETHENEEWWYGPDLIEAVQEASVGHEIGSHTFSHVEFGRDDVTREMAAAELRRSVDLAERDGLDLDSFVFPRNNVGHIDLLADHGFTCYRGVQPDRWFDDRFRRAGKLFTYNFGRSPPPLVTPEVDGHGLVNLPASLYLFSLEGIAGTASRTAFGDPVVRQARLGVDAAVGSDRVLHLWLHPNNIVGPSDVKRLDAVFRYVRQRANESSLQVETMGEVAKRHVS